MRILIQKETAKVLEARIQAERINPHQKGLHIQKGLQTAHILQNQILIQQE